MYGKYKDNKLVIVDTLDNVETMTAEGFFVVPNTVIGGYSKDYYNDDFTIKTTQTLIDENIISIKPTEKVYENRIIDKTENELYIDGLKDLPNTLKIEDGEIISKTTDELYTDEVITREEWLNITIRPIRDNLLNDIDIIYCNALNLIDMTENKKAEWIEYKTLLKDYPSIATIDSVYPTKPS